LTFARSPFRHATVAAAQWMAPAEQCEGCSFYTSEVASRPFVHSRDVTYATFCQGPYEESARYRNFMDWEIPWYSGLARHSLGRAQVRHDASRLLPATGMEGLRDLLDDKARRRSDGQQLRLARPDRLWAAGEVGGFTDRLATMAERRAQLPYSRTPHCSVARREGRAFGRLVDRFQHSHPVAPKPFANVRIKGPLENIG
jgi:uncharacterized protein DUF899